MCFFFICLGIWQAYRAVTKQQILQQYVLHGRELLEAVPSKIDDFFQYRQIRLSGQFDNQHIFLLDNRFYQHQAGFNVIQVLHSHNNQPILVNRGFISHQGDHSRIPEISLIQGESFFRGRLYRPKKELSLSQIEDTPLTWPKIIQNIDFESIAAKLGHPIAPYVIMLDNDVPESYPSEWQPSIITPARHWGYAVQWWLLAVLTAIGTVIFYKRKS